MARRGRPRKFGAREANGRLQRPTMQQLREADFRQRMAETAVVAMQPHRSWAPDPRDPRLASALGRFCVRHGLRQEIFDAGTEWGDTYRRWRAAKGCPDPLHTSTLGGGIGPSDATVAAWWRDILRVEDALRHYGNYALAGARHLCLEDADIERGAKGEADAIVGLRVVAVEMGRLPKGEHPFVKSVERRTAA